MTYDLHRYDGTPIKYRLWSNIISDYVTKTMKKEEMIKYMKKKKFSVKVIREYFNEADEGYGNDSLGGVF